MSDHNSHSRVGQFFWGKIVKIVIAAKTGKMAWVIWAGMGSQYFLQISNLCLLVCISDHNSEFKFSMTDFPQKSLGKKSFFELAYLSLLMTLCIQGSGLFLSWMVFLEKKFFEYSFSWNFCLLKLCVNCFKFKILFSENISIRQR